MDPSFTYVFTKGNAAQAHTMDPSVFILRALWNYTHFHLQSNVWSSCCNLDEPCTHSLLTIVLVFRRPLVTHSSLIQQKLASIWKLPLWTFSLKTTIFSVLLFSTYLLTSGNASKGALRNYCTLTGARGNTSVGSSECCHMENKWGQLILVIFKVKILYNMKNIDLTNWLFHLRCVFSFILRKYT